MHRNDYIKESHGIVREIVRYEGNVYHLIRNRFGEDGEELRSWKFYPHYHEAMEVMIFMGEYSELLCDGHTYRAESGEVLVVPPGSIHDVTFWSRGYFEWTTIQIDYKHISDLIGNKPLAVPPRVVISRLDEIHRLIREFYFYSHRGETYKDVREKFNDLHVLARLLALLLEQGSEEYRLPDSSLVSIQKIIDYCYENYHKDLNLDELSALSSLSKYYMCRLFKKTTGVTIMNYLNLIKIEEAKKMLKSQGKNITETCFDCGFSSTSYFIELFKKHTGITPKQWLKSAGSASQRKSL